MSTAEPICREVRREDREALVSLWTRVFEDPAELAADFLDLLPEMGTGVLVEEAGRLLGAAYLLDGFTLLSPGEEAKRCGYLYAVAVEEQARGKGLGARLSRAAADLGRTRGAEFICTLPAEESLYPWYASVLSLHYVNRRILYSSPATPPAKPLSAEEYGRRREELLAGRSHVRLSPAALRFQHTLCRCYGGGFYTAGDSIFCAYRDEDLWLLPELLCPEGSPPAFDSLRTEERPYLCSDFPFPDGCLWNLSFD
ncbi:MAG: GNAT family N-acetyltransferase [Oscillospiraceae bacterium]|nr:GNAT family N-acetyltransferase [Oscillospiraceae bacterium]